LYGYETYVDTIELTNINLDLGTLVMQEDFICAVNVFAEDNETNVSLEWTNPVQSEKLYIINDMNEDMGGLANEPYEEVWMGNRFANPGTVTLTDADVFFTFDEGGIADSVSVDIFNEAGEIIATTEKFVTPWYEWVNLDLPNMTITGDYYIMVHWQNNEATTNFLCYDYDWYFNMPNTAYIKYPGEELILLGDFYGEEPHFSFWVRAHVLEESSEKGSKEALSYNVYRGLAEEYNSVSEWTLINTEPVTETSFIDDTWPPIGVNNYMYAVEAIYAEADAEVTFSNNIFGGTTSIAEQKINVHVFPNPASDKIHIKSAALINEISKPLN